MAHMCLTALAALIVLLAAQEVVAKRGCSSFGHSCYGGHGKRSANPMPMQMSDDSVMGTDPTMFPRRFYTRPRWPTGDYIPVKYRGITDDEYEVAMTELMKLRLRNMVKHWMDNYRRNQQLTDESSFLDNA